MTDKIDKWKINLILLNGSGYVFNNKDYLTLRSDFRIIGKLNGSTNSRGYTSHGNSLPVELSEYETYLLLQKNIVTILKKNCVYVTPNRIERQEVLTILGQRVYKQEELFIKVKDIIAEEQVLNGFREGRSFKIHNALLDISHEHLPKHDAALFTASYLPPQSSKYCIFRDMWERGYYVTSGEAFGADFIAYPGDPLIYHGTYVINFSNNTLMNIYAIVAKSRLSVTVNKLLIYAYKNYAGDILYQTIHWEGQRVKNI